MSEEPEKQEEKSTSNPTKSPYLDMKFEGFLNAIGEAQIDNWTALAEALGVHRDTIYRWRKHPLAKKALTTEISRALEKMEKVGGDDWKMWREKAKILGVKEKSTIEHEVGEEVSELLDKIDSNYGELGQKAREQMVANDPSIQDKE